MPSPFPGMNPYLEQDDAWQDFHNDMISGIREALGPQVSPHFIVKGLRSPKGTACPARASGDGDVGNQRQETHLEIPGQPTAADPPGGFLTAAWIASHRRSSSTSWSC